MLRHLVVNADDLGLTVGVNDGIFVAHDQGILTSASVFANAPATINAVHRASARPSLGIGIHLALVDGTPMLPPHRVPSLRLRPPTGYAATSLEWSRSTSAVVPWLRITVNSRKPTERRASSSMARNVAAASGSEAATSIAEATSVNSNADLVIQLLPLRARVSGVGRRDNWMHPRASGTKP